MGKADSKNDNFVQIMNELFAEVTKAFKKDLKKASHKEKTRKQDSESDSSWSVGLGRTGDLNVSNISKRLKLDIPSGLMKTTLLDKKNLVP